MFLDHIKYFHRISRKERLSYEKSESWVTMEQQMMQGTDNMNLYED